MGFQIVIHDSPKILEIIYPAEPSTRDITDYILNTKRAIDDFEGDWDCLVDQRQLRRLPERLLEHVASLNSYAASHGMRRCARVIANAVSALQVLRIDEQAPGVGERIRTFYTRENAVAWLGAQDDNPSP